MTQASYDRRFTPARPDLAADFLLGRVEAVRFVSGERRSVTAPVAPLRRKPQWDCGLETQALRGEVVVLYEESDEGWAWVQLLSDGYVGYVPSFALGPAQDPTHRVSAMRTFVYPGPDLKLPTVDALSFGARLVISGISDGYAACSDGFVWAGHLGPLDVHEADYVAVAERFLGVPYLWGGKSSLGLDCSGLVQISLAAAGFAAPRDSDVQQRDLGSPVTEADQLRRGDLVFWKGHVAIMRDDVTLMHANAHTMMVSSEPLAAARARISKRTGGDILSVKRL